MSGVALHVWIRDKGAAEDAPISVEHVFYGRTEDEADKKRLAHLAGCENFALAEAEGRVSEAYEDRVQAPTWEDVESEDEEDGDEDEEEETTIEIPGPGEKN